MRGRIDDIHARGAELVLVGNGAPMFARTFREDLALEGPILVDPELRAYRAAGLRRGRVEVLSPRLPLQAVRALASGARQGAVEGDPWQLGGVFVIRPDGSCSFRHESREAGDHAPLEAVLDALEPDAPPLPEEAEAPGWLQRGLSGLLSRVVDPLIVPSFDRTGFRIHALGFDPTDLDVDLSGRRCLVTGANSGLGYQTALALADLGAEVVLLCRSAERGERAAEAIREATGSRAVTCTTLDVSDLAMVREVAEALGERPVDVLVHNAGVLPDERTESPQGLELTFATHVAGPFLLTHLLRPALARADGARVIWVSSGGMYTRRLRCDDLDWRRRPYDGVLAYAETKRAQVVLAEQWAEELRDDGVQVNAMHPGWADTPAVRSSLPRFHRVTEWILRSPAEGADTVVWLAASPAARHATGAFFFDRRARSTHLLPWTRESPADREALWRRCMELCDGAPSSARAAGTGPSPGRPGGRRISGGPRSYSP